MSVRDRHNFRVKADCSRVIQDVRKHSWVYVDSTQIFLVHQLAEHIQKLFDIRKSFYLLSKYENENYFLPFDEDIRILENNDTVIVVPDSNSTCSILNDQDSVAKLNSFGLQSLAVSFTKQINNQVAHEKSSYFSDKSSTSEKPDQNNENPSEASMGNSFYRTALYDTIDESKTSDTAKENNLEDKNLEDSITVKRKRVRKRKQKKTENVAESDNSFSEMSRKKPKIIDSVLIPSGKHIRFEGINDTVQSSSVSNENMQVDQNFDQSNKDFETKELSALLNLKHSSTPLTFSHKKKKKVFIKPETIDEIKPLDFDQKVETDENTDNNSIVSTNSQKLLPTMVNPGNSITKENISLNLSARSLNDTVSFKVFRVGEDYTPQLSSIILAQVLSADDSQYKLKILVGQEQLQEPQGKFSLPEDDENNSTAKDIVVLEKSKLIELTKIVPI